MPRAAVLQGMKYIDLHCDALTNEGVLQVTSENLRRGGCLLQCFAAFVDVRKCSPAGRFAQAVSLCEKFDAMCKREGYRPVRKFSEIEEGSLNAMLTVDKGGAIEGSLEKLEALFLRGVRMMTLTWNFENEIGAPNANAFGAPTQTQTGLTAFGKTAVERMKELGMLADVSHGSDRLVRDVAKIMKHTPFVASHSNAREVFPHPRNLGDGEIRRIADSGGVIGLNFFDGFLSAEKSAAGQKAALIAHAEHLIKVGGENVLALGSDFDGIPENPYLKNPACMPRFIEALQKKFGTRIAEKICRTNALRVLSALE